MEPVATAGGERILQVFETRLTQSIKALSFAQLLESSNVSVAAICSCCCGTGTCVACAQHALCLPPLPACAGMPLRLGRPSSFLKTR